ncbi:hypothetical protein HRbin29_00739 [bacterium HR29]|jgi:predicted Zn-ribbon and HTH transcriptional regulator|nr:hypothetical protein HRbin29_00739 [bacterium HR29]
MLPERVLRGARRRLQWRVCADCRARFVYDEAPRVTRLPRCPRCRSYTTWPAT